MSDFIGWSECQFVLEAAEEENHEPMHWDACPDCGGESFSPTER